MRVPAGTGSGLLAIILVALAGCGEDPRITREKVQEAWDQYNNPALLDGGAVVVFSQLPQVGQTSRIPWSDTYWPSFLGGISLRWRSGIQPQFGLARLTEAEVRSLTQEQLAELSPAEKYDIFMGRFDYPTVHAELSRNHPSNPQWYGLCHGWASASLNFAEPAPITLRSPSGIDIPFGSSDVKALLAYAQGVVFFPPAVSLGQRCEVDLGAVPAAGDTPACRDTNAGSFHLVLTNFIGRRDQSVIADFSRGSEVWNHPIYGYSSREVGRQGPSIGAAPQTVSEVSVETEVSFVTEIDQPSWLPVGDSRSTAVEKRFYSYVIELDAYERIVGGRWISEERPDFLWIQQRAGFSGYYKDIELIYLSAVFGSQVGTPVVVPSATPAPAATPEPIPSPDIPPAPPMPNPEPIPALPEPPMPVPAPVDPAVPSVPADPVMPPPASVPMFECPIGTTLVLGGSVLFCSDGQRAYAPQTSLMMNECLRQYGTFCMEPFWPNDIYIALRGQELCPAGAAWSSAFNACVENTSVLGPFSRAFTEKCLAGGFGNICLAMRMDVAYFSMVNMSR